MFAAQTVPSSLNIYAHTVSITQARISESRPGLKTMLMQANAAPQCIIYRFKLNQKIQSCTVTMDLKEREK